MNGVGRGGRLRSRDRGNAARRPTQTEVEDFKKPNLPTLKGAPSARRQYAYGAGTEPSAPRRLSNDGMPLSLEEAMNNVLQRQELQEAEEERELQRLQSNSQTAHRYDLTREPTSSDHDSELGSDDETNQQPRSSKLDEDETEGDDEDGELTPTESDDSDLRSFDAEGDYFGNASLRLSPMPQQKPALLPVPLNRTANHRRPLVSSLGTTQDQYDRTTPDRVNPTPNRAWSAVKSLLGGRILGPVSPPESDSQISQTTGTSRPTEQNQSTARTRSQKPPATINTASQSQDTDQRAVLTQRNVSSSARLPPATGARQPRSRFASDHSELDDAVQNNIREAESYALHMRQGTLRRILASLFPWGFRPRSQPRDAQYRDGDNDSTASSDIGSDFDSELDSAATDESINLQQLFNPLTYLQAIYWFFSSMIDSITSFVSEFFSGLFSETIRRRLSAIGEALVYTVSGFSILMLAVVLSSIALANLPSLDELPVISVPSVSIPTPPGFGDLASRIGNYMPSISWPSRSAWDEFPELDDLRGAKYAEFEGLINQVLRDLRLMKGAGKLHESSIEKLNTVVPKMVHMTLKDGKPVITQEFWHAMRDLIEKDGSFPMLDKKGNNYEPSTEKQWKDIAAWVAGRPEIASKINEANDAIAKKLPHMWEAWAGDNQRRVEKTLRPILDKMKITGSLSDKDLDKRLDQIIKKHVESTKSDSTVVTREYFLQYLKNEFAAHWTEMKAEINELQPRLEQQIRDSLELAKKDDSSSLTRAEVTKLVDRSIRKAIADLNLEAMAKGQIRAHWDTDLKNQVNYFGVGAGAIVDVKQTSTTFKPDAKYLNDKGLKGAQPYPPIEALLPWHDDGDCWCAAREVNKRGNPHGAKLSVIMGHSIIPQHIVIEHILPGATTNPGARPRQIEVYIKIEDRAVRERLLDFAAANYPEDQFDWNYTPADLPFQFVKVSQFVYEGAELHDGVHVHRLSSELVALNAETDQVIVRAVSNYGAPNHTCFYRIRLYGYKEDDV
ncbi:hypothetical protein TRIATDRAFT_292173 [Trichoderma atroviride IMI 206040]|uniref:SUN domain-containing protein n=1 Tax=Hypocrea atroviridis (strain ATCC 20476 / IMI 206040) TaxID=452589 RepID=G9NT78_HYPAI|nr:uncharacterized protein TRIATDRAFT_292173 [Trichoderma atroviride IMI 206040]EHK45926.1 hypothetical protein TRIATDRAFT_292173 [Trichoderma atroviride IMI 206040]